MKLYLDNSFLNRPFDDLSIVENRLEAEILFFIVHLIEQKKALLVNSAMIEYENSLNPFLDRKIFVERITRLASENQAIDANIKKSAETLIRSMQLKPFDAFHIAIAQCAKVDFFITCDYYLIRKYKGNLKVIKPLYFIKFYENKKY